MPNLNARFIMKKLLSNSFDISPEPKTKAQIAMEMNIHLRTLQRRLEKANLLIPRGLIFPEQQAEIYRQLGWDGRLS